MELIFEKSRKGRIGGTLPGKDVPSEVKLDPKYQRESEVGLPCVSEPEVVRHFTNLSKMNFGVDGNFYPLGSCTMKYNPKFTEKIADLEKFTSLHPLQPQLLKGDVLVQGALEIIYNLEKAPVSYTHLRAHET